MSSGKLMEWYLLESLLKGLSDNILFNEVLIGNIEKVKEFLDNGLDILSTGYLGKYNIVEIACAKGHSDLLVEMLKYPHIVEQINDCEALVIASKYGYTDVFDILVRHGADINKRSKIFKLTPLEVACNKSQIDIVDRLLASNVNIDNALFYVQDNDILHRLLLYGANPLLNKIGTDEPLLHCVVRNERKEILKELVTCGINLNVVNNKGQCALMIAISNVLTEEDRHCLEIIFDDDLNFTPKKNLQIAVMLLKNGILIDNVDKKGRSIKDYIDTYLNYTDTVHFLKQIRKYHINF